MSQRTQESPFRETAWDQKLDRMLDDLKTTVRPEFGRSSSGERGTSLTSSFRNTSRSSESPKRMMSDSYSPHRGGGVGGTGVTDAGQMKHLHREYTSPDKSTKVVSDEFKYDSGEAQSKHFQKKVIKSTYSNYKVSGGISNELDNLKHGPDSNLTQEANNVNNTKVVTASQKVADKLVDALSSIGYSPGHNSYSTKNTKYSTSNSTNLKKKPSFDESDWVSDKGGEVSRIVWRNRFEKTYENKDSNAPPSMTIEEAARRRDHNQRFQQQHQFATTTTTAATQPDPPLQSPRDPNWPDPIPMPTPPQVTPYDPGVAYVYTYGKEGAGEIKHLPPLNYVRLPGATYVPPSGGDPSPNSSSQTVQPVIYHYSYHYTLQPGQPLPDGMPGAPHQPALQIAPQHHYSSPPPQSNPQSPQQPSQPKTTQHTSYSTSKVTEHHHHHHPGSSLDSGDPVPVPISPIRPQNEPEKGSPFNQTQNININKTTTTYTTNAGYPREYPMMPATSTPYHSGRRSRSASPDRYRRSGTPTGDVNMVYVARTTHLDSLERVRSKKHSGLPFPETDPLTPQNSGHIPRKVDDLMTSFSDSEDGRFPTSRPMMNGLQEREPLVRPKPATQQDENIEETVVVESLNQKAPPATTREESKNVSGPPVYYPPGHANFNESMHTMTLKENKRRGLAKWRAEKASGYKESSSQSESKGGMAMVPVCLPLCCGAACVIM